MSAQYVPLQGDPAPYSERSDTQTEQSSSGNENECLKPGELARVVYFDPIVEVVPMRAGWASSTIEVKRSALPKTHYFDPDTMQFCWMMTSFALLCSNYRFDSPFIYELTNALATMGSLYFQVAVLFHFSGKICPLIPILLSVNALSLIILQLVFAVVCYHEAKDFFVGTLFALITMVLLGSFTVFLVFSHCKQAGDAAIAAVAADESEATDECGESHSMVALPHSQRESTVTVYSEQKARQSHACDYSRKRTGIRAVHVVRYDPIINVVPFDGDWRSSHIIVRRSVLPLKLRRAALLLQFLWMLVPFVVVTAGMFSTNVGVKRSLELVLVGILTLLPQAQVIELSFRWTWPFYPVRFTALMFPTATMQQVVIIAVSYYDNRTCFVYNLGGLVLLVLFGMISATVVYQYNYQAGKAAMNALAAERARSSLSEDDINHKRDSTSKATGRQ